MPVDEVPLYKPRTEHLRVDTDKYAEFMCIRSNEDVGIAIAAKKNACAELELLSWELHEDDPFCKKKNGTLTPGA